MVTPMPTPTTTSVGASTPKAIRAPATTAITPAASHLPVLRQRPSGTSVYSTPMQIAVKNAIWSDGSAQPPQLDWMSTPERAWPAGDHRQDVDEVAAKQHDDEPHQQMPPAPQDQQCQQQPVEGRVQHRPGTDAGHAPQQRRHPRP